MSAIEQLPQVISFRDPRDVRIADDYSNGCSAGTSLHDQAALLLSIADIARCEITTCPSALTDDGSSCPSFPSLDDKAPQDFLAPRMGSLRGLLYNRAKMMEPLPSRLRTVSFDHPALFDLTGKAHSPLASPPRIADVLVEAVAVSPVHHNNRRSLSHRSTRLSHKVRHDRVKEARSSPTLTLSTVTTTDHLPLVSPTPMRKTKSLQGKPTDGVAVKKIFRRKFSWKNYPELEHYLVANREEYLRHSALNYTLQQKQYNNRLTEDLLKMATKYGYMFDEREFSFVTVRDRIRCYYKSFVQSAKKRGILMGYAARKAGLLDDDGSSNSSNGSVMDEDDHQTMVNSH